MKLSAWQRQEYRPQHLLPDLEMLITESARSKLDAAFAKVKQEYDVEYVVTDMDEKTLNAKYGNMLMDMYMDVLQDPECYNSTVTSCLVCARPKRKARAKSKRAKTRAADVTQDWEEDDKPQDWVWSLGRTAERELGGGGGGGCFFFV